MSLIMEQKVPDQTSSVLETMKSIASKPDQDDPFYVLELEDLFKKVQQFRRLLPRVEAFYGVKYNDDGTVLDTLASLGVNFNCSSKGEISKVLSLGVSPSRIIYTHPYKTTLDLEFASMVQVSLMTFDSREELLKIQEIYPKTEIILRINFDAPQSDGIASVEDSVSLLSMAHDLDLHVVGVSIHVDKKHKGPEIYRRAIAAVQQIFDEGKALGMNMNLLDIGNGFPGKGYWSFEELASNINEALNEYFPADKNTSLRVIAEPSRYMVTSAFTLCTRIIAKKKVQSNHQTTNMYYVNAGIFNAFWVMKDESVPLCPRVLSCNEGESDLVTSENSIIWGPTLCPIDVIMEDINFPSLECGDWIYWPDMGTYTLTVTTNFNCFPVPEVHVTRMSSFHEKYENCTSKHQHTTKTRRTTTA